MGAVMANLELPRDIDRYMCFSSLQEERAAVLPDRDRHIDRIMPLIYTPTVGEACRTFSHIARDPKGSSSRPTIADDPRLLGNWPSATSASCRHRRAAHPRAWRSRRQRHGHSRSASSRSTPPCAGIDPNACLPVTLDVGTNNEELRNDVLYLGYPRKRLEARRTSISSRVRHAVQSRYPTRSSSSRIS
jgi:malate dehydrogenase (oxaloacetate-decarboxylating)(NADP+)